mmetsp:Transcript_33344/g.57103  ORF Transcript_33344/g.57103 Transcript_33344/m.57103 type:complete len:149 (-) Transcript_33344:179-625(-)
MGYSLCAGVAATLAQPAPARAIVVAGDGGIQMTLCEMATFSQHKREGDSLLVVVFDNSMLGRVAFGFVGSKGCELEGPDLVALAKAYGGAGLRIGGGEEPLQDDEVAVAVAAAMASTGLFLMHVVIDPTLKADMAKFKDGSIALMESG